MMSDSIDPEKDDHTWHRDNPCRRTGYGPDWNTKEKYNVVSSMVYLTESDSTLNLSLIHISEPTRQAEISYAVFCLKKKKKKKLKKKKKKTKKTRKTKTLYSCSNDIK